MSAAEKQPLLQTSDCHSGPAYHSPSAQADMPYDIPQEVNRFEHPSSNQAPNHAHPRPIDNRYQTSPYPLVHPQPTSPHYGAIGGGIQVGAHIQELQDVITEQPKSLGTSFTLDTKNLQDNQYYFALCLLFCSLLCFNPFAFTCSVLALIFAYKAAVLNLTQGPPEEARAYHKQAQSCNLCSFLLLATIVLVITPWIIMCVATYFANINNYGSASLGVESAFH